MFRNVCGAKSNAETFKNTSIIYTLAAAVLCNLLSSKGVESVERKKKKLLDVIHVYVTIVLFVSLQFSALLIILAIAEIIVGVLAYGRRDMVS